MVNSRELVRRTRMEQLSRTIAKAKEKEREINKEQFVANICLKWGISKRTALEYIGLIIDAKKIKVRIDGKNKYLLPK